MVVGHRAFTSPGGIAVHEGHASGSRKSRVPVITMLVPMIAGCVADWAAFGEILTFADLRTRKCASRRTMSESHELANQHAFAQMLLPSPN